MKRIVPLCMVVFMLLVAAPSAMATPKITAASFTQNDAANGMLTVRATDPRGEVSGIAAAFGNGERRASSSCVYGAKPRRGKSVRFRLSHNYTQAGTYTIRIRVITSNCTSGKSARSALVKLRVVIAESAVAS